MADESMVRNLDAQAHAIWPQEIELVRRYALPEAAAILDAGCGTGEITSRVAHLFTAASVLGVDIVDAHLQLARTRYAELAPRVRFEHQSVYELEISDDAFDLTLCRHVLHSIPHVARVVAELVRVTRPGGFLHLIPEDYGMLAFQRAALDPRDFWHEVPASMSEATGTDLFSGRDAYGILARQGLEEISIDYVIVDPLRVARETFSAILTAWRDGYAGPIGETTAISKEAATSYFDQMIDNVRDPFGYAVWFVPVVSARKPGARGEEPTAASAAAAASRSRSAAGSATGTG